MRPKAFVIVFLFVVLIPLEILSQSFIRVDPGFPVAHQGAVAWADVDNDGDLDAFISGMDENSIPRADVFRKEGSSFIPFNTSIMGLYSGSCAFGDYNNDGLADLLYCGTDGTSKYTLLYRNDGNGSFTNIGAGLPGVSSGDVAWADYNNDGFADILISGKNSSGQSICLLYTNNAGISFSNAGANITGLSNGEMAWSDIDLDGDMDFAINGTDNAQIPYTLIYLNNDGAFSQMGSGITGLKGATLAWGDYNNDSWPDLLITGADASDAPSTMVYKNNAGSSFTALSGPYIGVVNGSGIWGDLDNDGDLDILIGGSRTANGGSGLPPTPGEPYELLIYANQGNDQFLMQSIQLPGIVNCDIVMGDYDDDTDLDLLLCGEFLNAIGVLKVNTVIYRNGTLFGNIPPSAPTGLAFVQNGNDVSLSWNPATDDKTPSAGLNYNLRIGNTDISMNVMSALADLNNGYRRMVATGNTAANTNWDIHNLEFGEYYASVQAIDPAYAGSAFSTSIYFECTPTASFSIVDSLCIMEETVITYTGNASTSAQYNWDFDGAVVVAGSGPGPYTVYWDTQGLKSVSLTVTENGMTSAPYEEVVMIIAYPGEASFIAGPDVVCQGEITEYLVPPIAYAEAYEWYVNPPEAGTVFGNTNIVHILWGMVYEGNALVFVRGTNFCGEGPFSDSLEISINPLPGQPLQPIGPANLCQNNANTTYQTGETTNALGYQWTLMPESAGLVFNNGLEAEIAWSNSFAGQASLTVSAFNNCGAGPVSEALIIDVALLPDADAGENQIIELGSSTQLSGSASGGSGSYSYYWMPDTLLVDPSVADPMSVPLYHSVQFFMMVTDTESGCADNDHMIVTVIGGPLYMTVSADPDSICSGDSTQLLALAGGGSGNYSFSWTSSPPGFTSSAQDPVAYPDVTTVYYVELIDGTEILTDSVTVVVLTAPEQAGTISGQTEVCVGSEQVQYNVEPVPGATAYLWELSDGMYGSSNTNTILVSFPVFIDDASIKVTPANDCGIGESSSLDIEMISSPDPPTKPYGPDSLCTTTDTIEQYQISEAVPGADSYEWEIFPDEAGTMVGDGLSAEAHWVKNWDGNALVRVRARNNCGSSYWSETLEVYAFNCLGINDIDGTHMSILIYPNPTSGKLHIELSCARENQDIRLLIRDLFGRVMFKKMIESGSSKYSFDLSYLPKGMYILSLDRGNDITISRKLVLTP